MNDDDDGGNASGINDDEIGRGSRVRGSENGGGGGVIARPRVKDTIDRIRLPMVCYGRYRSPRRNSQSVVSVRCALIIRSVT